MVITKLDGCAFTKDELARALERHMETKRNGASNIDFDEAVTDDEFEAELAIDERYWPTCADLAYMDPVRSWIWGEQLDDREQRNQPPLPGARLRYVVDLMIALVIGLALAALGWGLGTLAWELID